MPVQVALLRGINVGAHKRVKMDALRQLFAELGFDGAQTYLQSGNVVFQSTEPKSPELARRIEAGICHAFGFHSHVILRTTAEIGNAVAANPLAGRSDLDPAKFLVLFLDGRLSSEEEKALRAIEVDREEIYPAETELYVYYRDGINRSKIDLAMNKVLKTNATGRNWRSVENILSMMQEKENRE
jgi:uncharacterized protein (DUF1697 family)